MRDFAAEIRDERCWDRATEAIYRARGIPIDDTILQTRAELVAFCEWIELNRIRSYLEVGVWTGRLFLLLDRLFQFEKAAACDLAYCRLFGLPFHLERTDRPIFVGDSHSKEYREWLTGQGRFDLILIDGDHSYPGVSRDFEINAPHSDRFVAFHDIVTARRDSAGVKRLWDELGGEKVEIVRDHAEIGADGPTMGIGIWRAGTSAATGD